MSLIESVLSGESKWFVSCGDCLEETKKIPDDSIDSMVTDPPAGIGFMGKKWDSNKGGRDKWIDWLASCLQEAYRVLKSGGYIVVWALPRTSHWTGMAIEDAGFDVIDSIHHTFASGMPKSYNISQGIDKKDGIVEEREKVFSYTANGNASKCGGRTVGEDGGNNKIELSVKRGASEKSRKWDGYGTNQKPSHEVWFVAQKPFECTIVENVLTHGCGGMNIDACRIGTDWHDRGGSWFESAHSCDPDAEKIAAPPGTGIQCHPLGRFPCNSCFTHHPECRIVGYVDVDAPKINRFTDGAKPFGGGAGHKYETVGGGTNTIPVYDCVDGCPVLQLREQSLDESGRDNTDCFHCFDWNLEIEDPFIYLPKPSRKEREAGCEHLPLKSVSECTSRKEGSKGLTARAGAGRSSGRHNHHPTLKSIALMTHFVKLVTRPGGVVLSQFMGSGTDGCAAVMNGFRFIGFDIDPEFVQIAKARISYWENRVLATKKSQQKKPETLQIDLFGTNP